MRRDAVDADIPGRRVGPQSAHQPDHPVLAGRVHGNGLAVVAGAGDGRDDDTPLRGLLAHVMHCELDGVHLTNQGDFQAVEFRLDGIALVIHMVEIVASVAEAGVGDHDVDSAEFLDGELEETEEAFPGAGVAFLVDWSVDGFGGGLHVADEDFDAGFGEVVDDALANAAGAAGDDGGFASELVAWSSVRGDIIKEREIGRIMSAMLVTNQYRRQ
jgi:hypothetical protein